jgi:hypothetical protein
MNVMQPTQYYLNGVTLILPNRPCIYEQCMADSGQQREGFVTFAKGGAEEIDVALKKDAQSV